MVRCISVLWPSFLIAGMADIVFFTLFDPTDMIYHGEPLFAGRLAAYSVGFFLFWLLGIGSSSLTCYFQRTANEINRCPLPAADRPEGCPKREGCEDCT